MSYRKIVQVGATGNLGVPVHDALLKSGKFEITVLARTSSSFTSSNPSVKVAKLDYSNKQELVDVLRGNDAVVFTLGDPANLETNSKYIIDAAIEAGVKRIIPSEYGGDIHTDTALTNVVFTPKLKVAEYINAKSSAGEIEFTTITNGPFFDWGLTHQFLGFDIPNKKVTIYNGGTRLFNATTLESIATAIVSVLSSPEQYKNRDLRISDFHISQKDILSILEAETNSKFEVAQEVDADKLQETSQANLRKGDWSFPNVFGALVGSVFALDAASHWGESDDTPGLGIPKKDLREEIKKVLQS
ncbi:hypothetical protein M408DRAFT_304873 [Serendipita vermifera MAFF 305830]|uniref:NmrA-like domain-containing protein n=1 Tax=Serendipita vermifera MAFF 305830 TaxID=933852 RepID=A0A0C2WVB0_SERVB|nr:hypothetical protein M408DRAFT_304873 [Serendipita vermifera MAFF 305830]